MLFCLHGGKCIVLTTIKNVGAVIFAGQAFGVHQKIRETTPSKLDVLLITALCKNTQIMVRNKR